MLTKARLTVQPSSPEELDELLTACALAKNRYSLVGGFSPHRRVFRSQLRIPGLNQNDELDARDMAVMSGMQADDSVRALVPTPGGPVFFSNLLEA
eukprot:6472001-Amphidinium_carterae.4